MCDEYDEERMRVFWKQIAMHEDLANLKPEDELEGETPHLPVGEIVEPRRARPRSLLQ